MTRIILSDTKNVTFSEYVAKTQGYMCSYVYVNRNKAGGIQT